MATEKRLILLDHALQAVSETYRSDMSKRELRILIATRKRLKSLPTAVAVEVVHGRLGPSYIDEYYGEWKDCLECGADNILPCNYCRNCGAKMDGGAVE